MGWFKKKVIEVMNKEEHKIMPKLRIIDRLNKIEDDIASLKVIELGVTQAEFKKLTEQVNVLTNRLNAFINPRKERTVGKPNNKPVHKNN
jgi:hypothetical protein